MAGQLDIQASAHALHMVVTKRAKGFLIDGVSSINNHSGPLHEGSLAAGEKQDGICYLLCRAGSIHVVISSH